MKRNANTIVFSGNTAWSMFNFRKGLLLYYIEKGFDVFVLAPYDSVFSDKIRSLGCSFIDIKLKPKSLNPFADLALCFSYYKTFKRIRPSYVIGFTIKPNIYGAITASFLSIPYIAVVTGLGYTFIHNNIISYTCKLLYRFAFKGVYRVCFLNQEDLKVFLNNKITRSDKAIVFNGEGLDLSYYVPDKTFSRMDKTFRFLFVGRIIADKGIREYVSVAKRIKEEFKDVSFQILGFTGVQNPNSIPQNEFNSWIEDKTIEYLGSSNDVRSFINQADCIVLPSYREGIPRSLLEAAALEKPIITTSSVGCKDTVDDGISGFLCKPKDISSLYDCCVKMLQCTPLERDSMGKAGRQKMLNEFDQKIVFSQYDTLLSSLK